MVDGSTIMGRYVSDLISPECARALQHFVVLTVNAPTGLEVAVVGTGTHASFLIYPILSDVI